ncbi:hypothetical protein PG996_012902 [Apiospora saccharicola]|uniref:Uncharacterized protein n=1 Tax=Apiospora saccharicola TaxID=335842 RepID=A0ABR1U640_9PEZI
MVIDRSAGLRVEDGEEDRESAPSTEGGWVRSADHMKLLDKGFPQSKPGPGRSVLFLRDSYECSWIHVGPYNPRRSASPALHRYEFNADHGDTAVAGLSEGTVCAAVTTPREEKGKALGKEMDTRARLEKIWHR